MGASHRSSKEAERVHQVIRRLESIRQTIQGELSQSQTEWTHELSSIDNHPADSADTTFRRELDVGLVRGLEQRLHEAERAEQKLQEGTYGLCDRCKKPINPERLKARPESVLCVRCAAQMEEPYVPPPSEEEVVPMPFGSLYGEDPVEATGEDFWQAVAEWGTSDTPADDPPAADYQETYVDFDAPTEVEWVEGIVGDDGDPLLDTVREARRRAGQSTEKEDEKLPDA